MTTNKDLLFIHVPKTAGTSIANISRFVGFHVKHHDIRKQSFTHVKDFTTNQRATLDTFSVVRNPWDRVLSAFLYLDRGGRNSDDAADAKRFVSSYGGSFDSFIRNAFTDHPDIIEQLHFIPQHWWLCSDNGDLIVSNILQFESLQRDLNLFFKKRDLPVVKLPRINTTEHLNYREYYDAEMVDIVANTYRRDIDLFNYCFD